MFVSPPRNLEEEEEAEMWLQEDTGLESGGQAPHTPPLFFFFRGRDECRRGKKVENKRGDILKEKKKRQAEEEVVGKSRPGVQD